MFLYFFVQITHLLKKVGYWNYLVLMGYVWAWVLLRVMSGSMVLLQPGSVLMCMPNVTTGSHGNHECSDPGHTQPSMMTEAVDIHTDLGSNRATDLDMALATDGPRSHHGPRWQLGPVGSVWPWQQHSLSDTNMVSGVNLRSILIFKVKLYIQFCTSVLVHMCLA